MKPLCKLCGVRHWTYEAHKITDGVTKTVTVSPRTKTIPDSPVVLEPVTPSQDVTPQHCPTCTCGERKIHASNAERQRAHRERSR